MRASGLFVVAVAAAMLYLSFYGLAVPNGPPVLPFSFSGHAVENVNRQVSPDIIVGRYWVMNESGTLYGIPSSSSSNLTVTAIAGTQVTVAEVIQQDGSPVPPPTVHTSLFDVAVVYDGPPGIIGRGVSMGDDLVQIPAQGGQPALMLKVNTVKNMEVASISRSVVGFVGYNMNISGVTLTEMDILYDQATGALVYERMSASPLPVDVTMWVTETNLFSMPNSNWDIQHILSYINGILALKNTKEALLIGGVALVPVGLTVAFWPKKSKRTIYM